MQITIDANQADQRLDRFLRKYCKPYPSITLSTIFARLRKGVIKVNGSKKREKFRLSEGDVISIDVSRATELSEDSRSRSTKATFQTKNQQRQEIPIEDIRAMILYEDKNRLVLNKPAGIVMHGGIKQANSLAMHDYLKRYAELTNIDSNETFSPQFCYRLDKDTSGVLIAAKTYEGLQYLNKIIRERKIAKEYMTVVGGRPEKKMILDKKLKKIYDKKFGRGKTVVDSGGQESYSEAKVLEKKESEELGAIAFLKVKIKTGRMHQIRVHLADAGYPVLGDIIYGNPVLNRKMYKQLKIPRQLLHCHHYSFRDELKKKQQSFIAPPSSDIYKVMS